MNPELPAALITRIADHLKLLDERPPGHCVRVDNLTRADACAVADELSRRNMKADVHVLSGSTAHHHAEINVDRAIELRNRKERPLLLLIPAGTGLSASSLDNSFEPLPLIGVLEAVSAEIEKELATKPIGTLVTSVRRALGRARQTEPWARFLGTVCVDPTTSMAGRQLWQVGLVPDLGEDGIELRFRRNAKAVTAIARPSRPTARVIDRLMDAEVTSSAFRQRLQAFLEQRAAGGLADPVSWTRAIGEHHVGELTFEQWPTTSAQYADLTRIKVAPFLRPNGSVDPQCKLRLEDDGQLYCEVAPEQPGRVVVRWTTEPARPSAVDSWRVEVLPPTDLRSADTSPIANTKVKGDKRRATLRVDVSEDDLATCTLFVVRLRALDADGNDLQLKDEAAAEAESDQFEVRLSDYTPPDSARTAGVASLPVAVLSTAIDAGGDLIEGTPVWDQAGQAFDVRIGNRRALVRASRFLRDLQHTMAKAPGEPLAFDAYSPLGEAIPAEDVEKRPLSLPTALAERRKKLLAALADRPQRDTVEILDWDDDLRDQARGFVQSYRRALTADNLGPETRFALLAMDTLSVRVATSDEEVSGLVLLPTHPLRLAWMAAHDQLIRGWANGVARAGKSKTERSQQVDLAMASRLSPANMPFIVLAPDGKPLVYTEELTYGAALYLPPDTPEPQSAADIICRAIDITRANAELSVSAQALTERFGSYREAHPGTGTLRVMALNPGTGSLLEQSLRRLALRQEATRDDEPLPDDPQRLEVIAYTDHRSYTDPVGDLRQLQRAIAAGEARREAATHLTPPLGLAVRDLSLASEDREGHHLAVVQDIARSRVTSPEAESGSRASATTAFHDLLTPLVPERARDGSASWYVTPALKSRVSGRLESDIADAHRAHQATVAAQLGLPTDTPALEISLDSADLVRFQSAHERADWVITLDRGIGPEIFEGAAPQKMAGTHYLLDYTPDFLEGLGKKLTVTTIHHDEVRRVLSEAMRVLDIAQDEESVSRVLNHLSLVSGRLALRLLRDTSLSVEAASLAAVMTHLEKRGQLADRIVVPVDAHAEIFGARPRAGEEPARRCDLLLVQVTQRSLRIECVEVKGRRAAQLPAGLADDIVDQLDLTERLLQRLFFAADPPRIDAALQRARLTGLLHYYADRSARYGHIAADKLPEVHRNIDRVEESAVAEITKTGYVISSDGTSGFPAKHRDVPIRVLTAKDLGEAGFTTISRPAAPVPASPESAGTSPVTTPAAAASPASDVPKNEAPSEPSRQESTSFAKRPVDSGANYHETPQQQPATAAGEVSVELGADGNGTSVVWNVSTKGSPHAFILGIPGQGKSVTTRRIIREFARQSLPSLVLDFHGDMAVEPPAGAQVIDAAHGLQFSPFELPSADPLVVNSTAWEVSEIVAHVCDLGDVQRSHVYDGLRQAYATAQGIPTMTQFADAVEQVERQARGRNARDRIRPLTDFGLFADNPTGTFVDSWSNGVVVDLSHLTLETVQLAAAAFILRKVYREMFRWEQSGVLRLAIVLDEAHRLARDVTLPKLMKEGRKYGVSVVVASQGMADFHRDVIGNAGTKIVFRTNFPESKATAGFLRGRDGQDLSQQIEQLTVGSAYVSTPDHVNARKLYMHP